MIIVEAVAPASSEDVIVRIAKQNEVSDYWTSTKSDKQVGIKMLVNKGKSQKVLDQLQTSMEGKTNFRVMAYPLDIALPYESKSQASVIREVLANQLNGQARLDSHFLMLVFLSTVVAAIGLIENNVAVIIGAMVIAPLLGPNLALSLATTLGRIDDILAALKSLFVGVGLALGLSAGIGILWGMFYPNVELTSELMARTYVGLDGIALALASGAAAALSITTGVSSVLVGVMVAVALLPPTVALGICMGLGLMPEAKGAAILLIANIASVNFTAQLTMRLKGIKPREEEKQRTALILFSTGIFICLALIGYLVYRMAT